MTSLPAFQFYPADWLNNMQLQSCSLAAQGLLMNIMCLMHQSEIYGKLIVFGKKTGQKDNKTVAKLLRISLKKYQKLTAELVDRGALHLDDDGVVVCKRMMEDHRLREIRREAGKLGGNPKLLNQKVNQPVKQKTTPSSSTSSSTSSSIEHTSKPLVSDCPHVEIINLYHEMLPSLPRVQTLTQGGSPILNWKGKDAQNLKVRWRENEDCQKLEWWRGFFEFIGESNFLMGKVEGKNRGKPFMANLRWIVNSSNFTKIKQGDYQ